MPDHHSHTLPHLTSTPPNRMCTLRRTFRGQHLRAMVKDILLYKFTPLPPHYSNEIKAMVASVLAPRSERATVAQLLLSPLLAGAVAAVGARVQGSKAPLAAVVAPETLVGSSTLMGELEEAVGAVGNGHSQPGGNATAIASHPFD